MATKKSKVSKKSSRGTAKKVAAKAASTRGRKKAKSTPAKRKSAAKKAATPNKKRSGSKAMTKSTTTRSAAKGGKSGAKRTKSVATATVVDLEVMPDASEIERRIAERAYFLWCERGGDETSNWLEAERQVVAELGSSR